MKASNDMEGHNNVVFKVSRAGASFSSRSARNQSGALGRPVPRFLTQPVLTNLVKIADVLLLISSVICVWFTAPNGDRRCREIIIAYLVGLFISMMCLDLTGAYSFFRFRTVWRQAAGIACGLATGVAGIIGVLTLLADIGPQTPAQIASAWLVAGLAILLGSRWVHVHFIDRWIAPGLWTTRTAVIGVNDLSRGFIEHTAVNLHASLRIVGVYEPGELNHSALHADVKVRGSISDLVKHSRLEPFDAIVIALPLSAGQQIAEICDALSDTVADIYLIAGMWPPSTLGAVHPDSRASVITIAERPIKDWCLIQKRILDVAVSLVTLVLISPILASIALLIRLDSPGPVLFRQPRLGFNNVLFNTYKFRTMFYHLEDRLAERQTTRDDPRITRVGRWLRRFSLDELPQFVNVLQGTMSLVGPRPHAPNTKAGPLLFTDTVTYARRHRVLPGITGWAQVNGWRGETKTLDQLESRIAHDLYYIENWSILLDVRIMFMTAAREIFSRSAF